MLPFLPLLPLSSTECNSTQPKHNFPVDLTRHLEVVQGNDSWEMTFLPEAAAHATGNMCHSILLFIKLCGIKNLEEKSHSSCCHQKKKASSLWELIVLG